MNIKMVEILGLNLFWIMAILLFFSGKSRIENKYNIKKINAVYEALVKPISTTNADIIRDIIILIIVSLIPVANLLIGFFALCAYYTILDKAVKTLSDIIEYRIDLILEADARLENKKRNYIREEFLHQN